MWLMSACLFSLTLCKYRVWPQAPPPFTQSGAWGRPQVPSRYPQGYPKDIPFTALGLLRIVAPQPCF